MKTEKKVLFCMLASALPAVGLQADVNTVLSTWNAVTVNNAQFNNEYEGAAYVGGNLTALQTLGSGLQNHVSATNESLVVGGNITAGGYINVQAGSVYVHGTSSANYNFNGGGALHTGSSVPASVSPVQTLINNSLYWSTLSANSTISTNNAQQLNFNTAAGSGVAVFNVTAAQTFNAGLQGFNLSLASGVNTVLINVSGGNINWTSGSFFSQFQTDFGRGNVLFNFYNATNIYLGNQFEGYIVAPNANVTLANNVDGGVMASNLVAESEVHLPDRNSSTASWYGDLPTGSPSASPVPEPATLALLPAGAAALWAFRRRSSKR